MTRGALRTVDRPDGTPVDIPVIIVRGSGDGPTLWLHGCVHGNEYCGTYIIHECIRSLDPDAMSGAVVALPILNLTAFLHDQRMSPYEGYGGGDLNRCFPGDSAGSLTQQIAHAIYQPLREYADYLVDFHTAVTEDTMWSLYANAEGETGREGRGRRPGIRPQQHASGADGHPRGLRDHDGGEGRHSRLHHRARR